MLRLMPSEGGSEAGCRNQEQHGREAWRSRWLRVVLGVRERFWVSRSKRASRPSW